MVFKSQKPILQEAMGLQEAREDEVIDLSKNDIMYLITVNTGSQEKSLTIWWGNARLLATGVAALLTLAYLI